MTRVPADLVGRVPTLTEVVEPTLLPDLADEAFEAPQPAKAAEPAHQQPGTWVGQVLDRLGPEVDALVASSLRDQLVPAIQDAVDEALDRLREPLVTSVQARLRELLEAELRRGLGDDGLAKPQPQEGAGAPDAGVGLRIP